MRLTWQPYAPHSRQPGSTDLLPAEPLPETSDYYYTDVIAYQWTMTEGRIEMLDGTTCTELVRLGS